MKRQRLLLFSSLIALFAELSLCAGSAPDYQPWVTGPILPLPATNLKARVWSTQPALFVTSSYGEYSKNWDLHHLPVVHTIQPNIFAQYGITDKWGASAVVSMNFNSCSGHRTSHINDTYLFLGHQISTDQQGSWIPDCRIWIEQVVPTGKYQRLHLNNVRLEATGQGAFETGPAVVLRKRFTLFHHFLTVNTSAVYLFPFSTTVHGMNWYGGGRGTKGKISPGQLFFAYASGEYSLTQKWVIMLESELEMARSSHFSGRRGTTPSGARAQVGLPSTLLASLAPSIEYNFSATSGALMGAWFSVAGRNSFAFTTGFASIVWNF